MGRHTAKEPRTSRNVSKVRGGPRLYVAVASIVLIAAFGIGIYLFLNTSGSSPAGATVSGSARLKPAGSDSVPVPTISVTETPHSTKSIPRTTITPVATEEDNQS